jgi:hypothetical protein
MIDHAAAHERLTDLALEPRRLTTLEDDATAVGRDLREHVRSCPDCHSELEAWRSVWGALDAAADLNRAPHGLDRPRLLVAGDADDRPASDPWGGEAAAVEPPAGLRSRLLSAIQVESDAVAGDTAGGRPEPSKVPEVSTALPRVERGRLIRMTTRVSWLATAAALVIALGLGGLAWQRSAQLEDARGQVAALASVTATLDGILASPSHRVVMLRTADGTPGGTLAWSSSNLVVLTSALPVPPEGSTYRCWVERNGYRTPVGSMWFSGSVGYWGGPLGAYGGFLDTGTRFGVSLVPATGGAGSPAVLIGQI